MIGDKVQTIKREREFEFLLQYLDHSTYRTGVALAAARQLLKRVEAATRIIQENHIVDQDVDRVLNGLQAFEWTPDIVADVESATAVRKLAKKRREAKRRLVIEILIQKEGLSPEEAKLQADRCLARNAEWLSPEEVVSNFYRARSTSQHISGNR
jgi:hypothetical protein